MAQSDSTIISICTGQLIEGPEMEELRIAIRCLHDLCTTSERRKQSYKYLKRWLQDRDLLDRGAYTQAMDTVEKYLDKCLVHSKYYNSAAGSSARQHVLDCCSNYLEHECDLKQVCCIGVPFCRKTQDWYLQLNDVVTSITQHKRPDNTETCALRVYIAALRLQDRLRPLIALNHCRRRTCTIMIALLIFGGTVATIAISLYAAIHA
jgi:hypothetical protein